MFRSYSEMKNRKAMREAEIHCLWITMELGLFNSDNIHKYCSEIKMDGYSRAVLRRLPKTSIICRME